MLEEFNEYLFEYTSKIPVKDIEKTIELTNKENQDEVASPYTIQKPKSKKGLYITIYLIEII